MCTLIHMLDQFDEVMKNAPHDFDLMNLYSFIDSVYGADIKSKVNHFVENLKSESKTSDQAQAKPEDKGGKEDTRKEHTVEELDFTNLCTLFNSLQGNSMQSKPPRTENNCECKKNSDQKEEVAGAEQSSQRTLVNSNEQKEWRVDLDMKQFRPEDVLIKLTDGNTLHIEGKFEDKQDDGSYTLNHMVKKYSIPEGYDAEKTTSRLHQNGVLSIVAPKISLTNSNTVRNIPVLRE